MSKSANGAKPHSAVIAAREIGKKLAARSSSVALRASVWRDMEQLRKVVLREGYGG